MKKCNYCGNYYNEINNDYDDIFCPFCGKEYHGEILLAVENTENDFYSTDYKTNKTKYWIGLAAYFGMFYIGAVIIQVIVSFIVLILNGWIDGELIEGSVQYEKYMNDTLAWSNLLIYLATCAIVLPFTFKLFKNDFNQFKKSPGNTFKWFGFGMIIMYVGIYASTFIIEIISFIFDLDSGDSANQEAIIQLMSSSGINFFIMTIMTVILAPILEEIIFRRCLFGIFKNRTITTVILSAVIFAGIHTVPTCLSMIPALITGEETFDNFFLEFIYILNYLGQGFALSIVYHKTRGNLIPCIMIHFANNLMATISIIFSILFQF